MVCGDKKPKDSGKNGDTCPPNKVSNDAVINEAMIALSHGQYQEQLAAFDTLDAYPAHHEHMDWPLFASAVQGHTGDRYTNRMVRFVTEHASRMTAENLHGVAMAMDIRGVPEEDMMYRDMVAKLPEPEVEKLAQTAAKSLEQPNLDEASVQKNACLLWMAGERMGAGQHRKMKGVYQQLLAADAFTRETMQQMIRYSKHPDFAKNELA